MSFISCITNCKLFCSQNNSDLQKEVAAQGEDVDRGEISAEVEEADEGMDSDQVEGIDQGKVDVESEDHAPGDDVPRTEDCDRGDDAGAAGSADEILDENKDSVTEDVSEDPVCIFCNKSRKKHQGREQKKVTSYRK